MRDYHDSLSQEVVSNQGSKDKELPRHRKIGESIQVAGIACAKTLR